MVTMASRWWLFAALTGTLLAGCGLDPTAAADPVEAELNTEFVLPGGQEATIRGEDLRLRFVDVLEDSRCPTQVECFWTGQARIVVDINAAGSNPVSAEFNTNPAPGQNVTTATVGDLTVELRSLEPYPETVEQSIPLGDYQAVLYVVRGG